MKINIKHIMKYNSDFKYDLNLGLLGEKLINDVLRLSKSLLTYLIFLFTLEFFVFVLPYAILVSS